MSKFKRNLILLFVGIAISLSTLFVIANVKDVAARDEYATEWKMSEGNSFQVIAGSLGNNTNGTPFTLESGQPSSFFVTYNIMPKNPSDPDLIEAGKFAFRIELPNDFDGTISRAANENWVLREGTISDPYGTPSGSDAKRYYWMVSAIDIPVTASNTLTFFITPFKNGITPHEAELNFSVALINLNDNTNVSGTQPSGFIANVNKFNWSNATMTVGGGGQTHSRTSTQPAADVTMTDLTFTVNATPNPNNPDYNGNSAVYGTAFAKSISYKNTYSIPMDSTDSSCPLIKIDESMFRDSTNNPFPPGVITLIKNPEGNVTGFTVDRTVTNPSQTAQFTNTNSQFMFRISAPIINADCPDIKDMPAGGTKTFSITQQTPVTHEVEPGVALNPAAALNGNGKRNIGQGAMPAMNFTYRVIQEEDPVSSFTPTKKSINQINGVSTNSMTEPFVARAGEIVRYEIGAERIQNTQTTNVVMTYEEKAGVDFNLNEIIPKQITVGTINPAITQHTIISLTYKNNTTGVEETTRTPGTPTNTTAVTYYSNGNVVNFVERTGWTIVGFKFETTINASRSLSTGHMVNFEVVDQDDLSKDGTPISNKVNQTYTNAGETRTSNDTATFIYTPKVSGEAGITESNKTGTNLNGGRPAAKDVVFFTIFLSNVEGAAFKVDEIYDSYSDRSLTLYNGTTTTVGGTEPIEARLLNGANSLNLLLWDEDPSEGSSTPIPFPGGQPTIIDNGTGLLHIEFKQDLIIPEGKQLYLTYTMSVNDNFVTNTGAI